MKFIFPLLNTQLDLSLENKVNILVIENQSYFTHFLSEINEALQNNESEIVLSLENTPLDISKKLELLTVFVPFDMNKKNLLTKLYKKAEVIMEGEDLFEKTQYIVQKNLQYIGEIIQNLPYSIDYSPAFDISYILKAADVKFDSDYESLAEQLIDYMETINSLDCEKCFVLVNIRNYIDDKSMDDFYKNIIYKKLKVLIVSANDYTLSKYEKKTIIDKDLCVI